MSSSRLFPTLALCAAALSLLALSLILTTLVFLSHHILSTPPHHRLPFFFTPSSTCQHANISLHHLHLHSIQHLSASLHLSLPESRTNLDNSVFQISAQLNSPNQLSLSHGDAHFSLHYRSPFHAAIRSLILSLPLLLGFLSEYQHMDAAIIQYEDLVNLHVPDNIYLTLHSPHVQIANAVLKLTVVRTSFLKSLSREGRFSKLLVLSTIVWYVALIALMFSVATMELMRGLFRKYIWSNAGLDNEVAFGKEAVPEKLSDEMAVPARHWSATSVGSASSTTFGWGGRRCPQLCK